MLTENEFKIFDENFHNYLKTGKLPATFKSHIDLNKFIENSLSYEQCQELRNKYSYEANLDTYSDFTFMWKCFKTLPRALTEAVVGGLVVGLSGSKLTEEDFTAKVAGGVTALGWLFTRMHYNAEKIRVQEKLHNECFALHEKTLNSVDSEGSLSAKTPGIFFDRKKSS